MNRRVFLAIGLLVASCLLLTQYKTSRTSSKKIDESIQLKLRTTDADTKTILYWTPMFDQVDFNLGLGSDIFKNCPRSNCYATHVKSSLPVDEYDAIVFHAIEYTVSRFDKPSTRNPRQVYVFSNQESPIHTPTSIKNFDNFYNWTMTYRLDSDIIRPYGYVEAGETDYRLPTIEEIENRPKKIAWFVSNCGTSSERELLYNEIKRHMPVDVYGSCGDLECPREKSGECYDMLEKQYKFYLAFENSICDDYVTEKLYNVLKRNVVPIVYGGADYSIIAPPKSVINVMNFKSAKHLVDHLRFLDRNPQNYLEYFQWKKNATSATDHQNTLCTLCQKLNEPIAAKTYTDIAGWWNGKNSEKCSAGFMKHFLR